MPSATIEFDRNPDQVFAISAILPHPDSGLFIPAVVVCGVWFYENAQGGKWRQTIGIPVETSQKADEICEHLMDASARGVKVYNGALVKQRLIPEDA